MNFEISTIAQIARVGEEAVVHAAKIFGYRRVAGRLCLSGKIGPEFIYEILRLDRMMNASAARRNARTGPDPRQEAPQEPL